MIILDIHDRIEDRNNISEETKTELIIIDTDVNEIERRIPSSVTYIDLIGYQSNIYGIDASGGLWNVSQNRCLIRLSPDHVGGYPRWLATYENKILAGGDGLSNQSIYIIYISRSSNTNEANKPGVSNDRESIRIDRFNASKSYTAFLNSIKEKHSVMTSVDQIRVISATITNDATYYLIEIVKNRQTFLIYKSFSSLRCRTLRNIPGDFISIKNNIQNDKVIGFFQTEDELMYGKLTSSHGLITRTIPHIDLKGNIVCLTLLDSSHTLPDP